MRNPMDVLNSLSQHNNQKDYTYERIYRNLYNPQFFYTAYQNIYAKEGNMTKGSDDRTIDAMSLKRIDGLIEKLKNETYQPAPARRHYIPKKNGKKRPLGIPSFDDKLVQEAVRMILESIYDGYFEPTSHGFRPNCSCHTALTCIQKYYSGVKWFIEGDIHAFFDEIDHDILTDILRERIKDEKFIRLIRKFLRAGYMEDWQFHKTYSGTPQGGVISPILANIYLDKLDKYMKEYAENFNMGKKRAVSPEYWRISSKIRKRTLKLRNITDVGKRQMILEEVRELKKQQLQTVPTDPMDNGYKRFRYERYADDFLIGVIGSKEDCRRIKQDIKVFLEKKLHLELSDEKTLITNAKSPAKFLGYEITVRHNEVPSKGKNGRLCRNRNGTVVLKIPPDVIKKKLLGYGAMKLVPHNGTEIWKPCSRDYLITQENAEIVLRYNMEIRGLYNYYSLALNCGILNNFRFVMQYSMFKTLANKHKCSKKKIIMQMRMGKDFGVKVQTAGGKEHTILFYNDGFKRKKVSYVDCDSLPNGAVYYSRTKLTDRLAAKKCELCGIEGVPLQMHHVRKLKDLRGKDHWEVIMIARQRKTLAVCEECHRKIHNGKLD